MTTTGRSPSRTEDGAATIGSTHQPLRERVRDLIRERIVSGELIPGDRLVERVLAEEMGVSRVPVREALHLLKGEGFAQDVPRRGVVVTTLSPEDLDDLFDVRAALEVQCARLAAVRASDEEIVTLTRLADDAEAAVALGETERIATLNQAFHDALTAMAHNRLLAATLEPLEGRLHWILRQNRANSDSAHTLLAQHRELVIAIHARDEEAAASITARHVAASREIAREVMFGAED